MKYSISSAELRNMSDNQRKIALDKLVDACNTSLSLNEQKELWMKYHKLILLLSTHFGIDENKDICQQVYELIDGLMKENRMLKEKCGDLVK